MTGYLAFDRDRVARLAMRLARSLDDLDTAGASDPWAVEADAAVRRAVDRMGPWVGRLGRLATNGLLTDLFTWAGPAAFDTMVIVADRAPLSSASDAALAGAVLADRFARLDLDDLTPADGVAELHALLRDVDPLVVSAFLTEIGAAGLGLIVASMSQRVDLVGRDEGDSTDIEAVVDLARTLGAGLPTVPGFDDRSGGWSEVWTVGDPVVLAEFLAGAASGLDDDHLTDASTVLLHRIADLDDPDPGPYWRPAGVSVMSTLAGRPGAARDTIVALDHADLEFLLFRVDPGAAGGFAHAATDPAFHSGDSVREPVTRIVETIEALGDRAGSSDEVPGASVDPQWWSRRESRFTPTDPQLPTGIGGTIAPWLGHLVAPIQIAGWMADPGGTEPWEDLDDDALAHALTRLMADELEALPLRLAAHTMLASSLGAGPATQQHAAYLAGAIEDAARAAGYHRLAGQATAAGAIGGLVEVVTGTLTPVASTAAGFVADTTLATITPDLRDAVAETEAAGFGIAAALGYAAVVAWRATEAPGSPPLPPLPTAPDVSRDDRADEEAGEVARLVTNWADSIDDPALRQAAVDLYNRIESSAAQGVGFVA